MSMSPPDSRHNSVTSITAQMADLNAPIAEHRKHMFAPPGHSPSWPTPPSEPDHEFHRSLQEKIDQAAVKIKQESQEQRALPSIQSPPVSPDVHDGESAWSNELPPLHLSHDGTTPARLPSIDRELFPEPSNYSAVPLFPKSIDEPKDNRHSRGKPVNEGLYQMFPQFRNMETRDLKRYVDECYRELKAMPGFRPSNPPAVTHRPSSISPARPTRVTKTRPAHVPRVAQPKAKAPKASTSTVSPARTPKTPTLKLRERNSASVEPQARKRAAPSKVIVSENWLDIADYSPPTSTLDDMNVRLKVHWKGAPNDLSADPEIGHLHPQEVEIAQELKLPAAQYLSNKRRIFEARLTSIQNRKSFTKTAAQQACNIDVNKTSQLYEAYERVGWFDEKVFAKWLQ